MSEEKQLTLDEERLETQLKGLREKRAEGWLVERLPTAPLHVPGCDDHANRFAWYRIDEPVGTPKKGAAQEYRNYGYTHFEKDVDV